MTKTANTDTTIRPEPIRDRWRDGADSGAAVDERRDRTDGAARSRQRHHDERRPLGVPAGYVVLGGVGGRHEHTRPSALRRLREQIR